MTKREKTNKIVLHHSMSDDVGVATIRQWHIDRGFEDIGYHYVIRLDGTIEKGRDIDMVGAHAKDNNNESIGICLTGDFRFVHPSTAQIDRTVYLYCLLCKMYNQKLTIDYHRSLQNPCPGKNFDRKNFEYIASIEIKKYINADAALTIASNTNDNKIIIEEAKRIKPDYDVKIGFEKSNKTAIINGVSTLVGLSLTAIAKSKLNIDDIFVVPISAAISGAIAGIYKFISNRKKYK